MVANRMHESQPLVSVLIPAYNAARHICETLDSVYAQSWKNIEIIVVDDGSDDDTVEQVRRSQRPNLYLYTTTNRGASAARNTAFTQSSGEFIQFLDADDILNSRKIEEQVRIIGDSQEDIVAGKWVRFTNSPAYAQPMVSPLWQDLSSTDWLAISRAEGLGMTLPGLFLLPRRIVNTAGPWNERLSLNDDGEYFTRVLLSASRVRFSEHAICYYRSVPGSLSSRKTPQAWQSAWHALHLIEQETLAAENTERMRIGLAKAWQHFAHASYPYQRQLATKASARAAALHTQKILPDGGRVFKLLSRWIGWRMARRLQVLSGRN